VSTHQKRGISRRTFVHQTGILAGGAMLASTTAGLSAEDSGPLPQRVLGRTGVKLTTLTLGTAPCGFAKPDDPENVARCVNAAIDLGVTSIDTAPAYDVGEQGVGMGLGNRRKDVFLATKVMADSPKEAEKIFANSLKVLKTDYVDLLYFHHVGDRKIKESLQPDGMLNWLARQKKAGKIRFVGASGHNRPKNFLPLIESGEIDVILTVVNFVDRHTYRYEDTVLPVARKHNLGIVAMKVYGGARGMAYANPKCPPQLDPEHLELAVRYSLGVEGVTTLDIGAHSVEQVKKNVALVANYKPLSDGDREKVAELGRKLAQEWKDHFGPVAALGRARGGVC
jgi:predicted aldo/keto reductase-like oxidoreductase